MGEDVNIAYTYSWIYKYSYLHVYVNMYIYIYIYTNTKITNIDKYLYETVGKYPSLSDWTLTSFYVRHRVEKRCAPTT